MVLQNATINVQNRRQRHRSLDTSGPPEVPARGRYISGSNDIRYVNVICYEKISNRIVSFLYLVVVVVKQYFYGNFKIIGSLIEFLVFKSNFMTTFYLFAISLCYYPYLRYD